MKNEKKTDWVKVTFWMFIYFAWFIIGFVGGMVFQQELITQELSKVLSYTDLEINVNFNETRFIEELNNTLIPELKKTFRENLTNGS